MTGAQYDDPGRERPGHSTAAKRRTPQLLFGTRPEKRRRSMASTFANIGKRIDERRARQRTRISSYLPNLRARQTYLNLLYLLAAFPLGTIYFIVFVTLIAVVSGSLIGLLLLPFTVAAWRWTGKFERDLSIWWLKREIAPFETALPPGTSFWDRLRLRLTDRVTWSTLAYLLLKFPFGV